MRPVAALCVNPRSVYSTMEYVECYDQVRDCRTYKDRFPVVCHPPCAQWSRMRAFAKVDEDQKSLAPFCLEVVRRLGGVLEHPAGSSFWKFAGLPGPGEWDEYGWTMVVDQSWFGFRGRKRTLLYVVGVRPVDMPIYYLRLGGSLMRVDHMDKSERSVTKRMFAEWLVDVARRSVCPA